MSEELRELRRTLHDIAVALERISASIDRIDANLDRAVGVLPDDTYYLRILQVDE